LAETDGSPPSASWIQIDRGKLRQIKRGKLVEGRRARNQYPPVGKRVAHSSAHPGINYEAACNEIEPNAYKHHAPECKEQRNGFAGGAKCPKHRETAPEQTERDEEHVLRRQYQPLARPTSPEDAFVGHKMTFECLIDHCSS